MGIDFSHCDASWSYMGFGHFRGKLAREIGINMEEMEGFVGNKSWDEIKDSITPLLNHSDCDGELTAIECRQVAPRLRELIAKWPEYDYDRQKGMELAEGMEKAADENKPLRFI